MTWKRVLSGDLVGVELRAEVGITIDQEVTPENVLFTR